MTERDWLTELRQAAATQHTAALTWRECQSILDALDEAEQALVIERHETSLVREARGEAMAEVEHWKARAHDDSAPAMREEWRSLVTLKYGDGGVSTHYHGSAADAEHFKAWRTGLHGERDGMVWPPVEIVTEHRYVTDWTRVIPPGDRHEFTEDPNDYSMCVCGVPALTHDAVFPPAEKGCGCPVSGFGYRHHRHPCPRAGENESIIPPEQKGQADA